MFTKYTLFLITIVLSLNSSAQVTYAKPEEFKEIKQRTLIVELLEVDQKLIDKWNKSKEKSDKEETKEKYEEMISDYKNFVESYNQNVKIAIEKYWDLNESVEYKSHTEVKALRKSKNSQYTVFWFSESSSGKSDDYGAKYFPNLTIPTLNYSRIESGTVKVDYSYFMHYTGNRQTNKFELSDLIMSMILMKNHIAEIESSGKKKYTFKDYVEDQEEINCSELKGKEIWITEGAIHDKASISGIKSNYKLGTLSAVSEDDISKAIESGQDQVVDFLIPVTIVAGSMGPLAAARIVFMKVCINVSSGTIYSVYGTSMGEFNDGQYRDKEFEKYGC